MQYSFPFYFIALFLLFLIMKIYISISYIFTNYVSYHFILSCMVISFLRLINYFLLKIRAMKDFTAVNLEFLDSLA